MVTKSLPDPFLILGKSVKTSPIFVDPFPVVYTVCSVYCGKGGDCGGRGGGGGGGRSVGGGNGNCGDGGSVEGVPGNTFKRISGI